MRTLRNILLFFCPFFLMIVVNECVRPSIKEEPYTGLGVTFMNPEIWTQETCSWACHNSSAFCEKHHIAYVRPIKAYIDPLYFGIIGLLQSTGNYGVANIIFLVVGWPLLMWYLLISCLKMRKQLQNYSHA